MWADCHFNKAKKKRIQRCRAQSTFNIRTLHKLKIVVLIIGQRWIVHIRGREIPKSLLYAGQ